MDLVVLAAGMGSRFGGLKQMEPMDGHGNFIIDYSIYDAIEAGFDRVVFIVRRSTLDAFRETVGKRIESRIDVEYVLQENDSVPDVRIPEDRTKPLGTAHAILCCKNAVKVPFMVVNADDFYGRGSFLISHEFLEKRCSKSVYGCVAYEAGRTMTENGSVKRGVCTIEDGNVVEITESSLTRDGDGITAAPLDGPSSFRIPEDAPVSMNMFLLDPSVFAHLEKGFEEFFSGMRDPMKDEYLLPDVISSVVSSGKAVLNAVRSSEDWYGVTYPQDKDSVVSALREMVSSGRYPDGLWE